MTSVESLISLCEGGAGKCNQYFYIRNSYACTFHGACVRSTGWPFYFTTSREDGMSNSCLFSVLKEGYISVTFKDIDGAAPFIIGLTKWESNEEGPKDIFLPEASQVVFSSREGSVGKWEACFSNGSAVPPASPVPPTLPPQPDVPPPSPLPPVPPFRPPPVPLDVMGRVADSEVRRYDFQYESCRNGSFYDELSPDSDSRRMFIGQGAKCSREGLPGVTLDAACHPALKVVNGATCAESSDYLSTGVDPSILEDLRSADGVTVEMWIEYDSGPAGKAASGEWSVDNLTIPGSRYSSSPFKPEFSLFSIGKSKPAVDTDTPAIKLWQQCGNSSTSTNDMPFALHASIQLSDYSKGCIRSLVGRPAQMSRFFNRESLTGDRYPSEIPTPRCFGFPWATDWSYEGGSLTGEAACAPEETVFETSETAVRHVAIVYDFNLRNGGQIDDYNCLAPYGGYPAAIYVDGVIQNSRIWRNWVLLDPIVQRYCGSWWEFSFWCAACGPQRLVDIYPDVSTPDLTSCAWNEDPKANEYLSINGECPISLESRFDATDTVLRIGSDGFKAREAKWKGRVVGLDLTDGNLGETESEMLLMHPFRGTVYSFSMHSRPLTPSEVATNAERPPFISPVAINKSRIVFTDECSSSSLKNRFSDFDTQWRGEAKYVVQVELVGAGSLFTEDSCESNPSKAVRLYTDANEALAFSYKPPPNRTVDCPSYPCCNSSVAVSATKLINSSYTGAPTTNVSIEIITDNCLASAILTESDFRVAYGRDTNFTLKFDDLQAGGPVNGKVYFKLIRPPPKGGALYSSYGTLLLRDSVIVAESGNLQLTYKCNFVANTCSVFSCNGANDVVFTDFFKFVAFQDEYFISNPLVQTVNLNVQNPLYIAGVSASTYSPTSMKILETNSTFTVYNENATFQIESITTEVDRPDFTVVDLDVKSDMQDAINISTRVLSSPSNAGETIVTSNFTVFVSTDMDFFSLPTTDLQGNVVLGGAEPIVLEVTASDGTFSRTFVWTAQWKFASLVAPTLSIPPDTNTQIDYDRPTIKTFYPLENMTMSNKTYYMNIEWLQMDISCGKSCGFGLPEDFKDDGSYNSSLVQYKTGRGKLYELLGGCPVDIDRPEYRCRRNARTYSYCNCFYWYGYKTDPSNKLRQRLIATPKVALEFMRRIKVQQTETYTNTPTYIAIQILLIRNPKLNSTLNVSLSTDDYCLRKPYLHGKNGYCVCVSPGVASIVLDLAWCASFDWNGPIWWGFRTGDWSTASPATYLTMAGWVAVGIIFLLSCCSFSFGCFVFCGYVRKIGLNRKLRQYLSQNEKGVDEPLVKNRNGKSKSQMGTADHLLPWSVALMIVLLIAATVMGIGALSFVWSMLLTMCVVLDAIAITLTSPKFTDYVVTGAVCLQMASFTLLAMSIAFWAGDKSRFMSDGILWAWITWSIGILGIIVGAPSLFLSSLFLYRKWGTLLNWPFADWSGDEEDEEKKARFSLTLTGDVMQGTPNNNTPSLMLKF